jgi:hypothetical protein
MADEHVTGLQHVENRLNAPVEIHRPFGSPLAVARQVERDGLMSELLEFGHDPVPAPGTVENRRERG